MSRTAAVNAFIKKRDYESKKFCVTHNVSETRLFVGSKFVARYQYAPGLVGRVLINLAGNHSDVTRDTLNALLSALNITREIVKRDGVHFVQSTVADSDETSEEISPFEWVRL